ncbi:MAG TPA: hypothetical protein VKU80_16830 [Planctomycetota bacterium]|nr:hypothetical protein [Planctomycetota bacterium]
MKHLLAGMLILLVGCASSGPPAPPLSASITFTEPDYEEKGGILPVTGFLTVTVKPEGEATSICKRQILTDVERSGELSNAQRWELYTKAEAWAAKAVNEGAPTGKPHCSLSYGNHRATWEKGASLPPELDELVQYIKSLTLSLSVVRKRA